MDSKTFQKTPLSEIRARSRETTVNHPYAPVIVTFLFFCIQCTIFVCSSFFAISDALWAQLLYKVLSFFMSVMMGLFVMGRTRYFALLCEEKEPGILNLFLGFRSKPDRVLLAACIFEGIYFITTLPAYIYSFFHPLSIDDVYHTSIAFGLLFLGYAAGFFITIPFEMLYYVLGDFINMPFKKAVRFSLWLMKGNYMRFLGLTISLIPFEILGWLSLGIGFLWISPLIQSAYAHFYLDLVKQKQ